MKNLLILCMLFVSTLTMAQSEVIMQTSAECGSCKERLEGKLNYTKGIKYAELDLHTMKLTVGYSPNKIDPDQIRTIISDLGYDADDVKANTDAQKELPACCQPGGMKHE